jgi:hypothetical protein
MSKLWLLPLCVLSLLPFAGQAQTSSAAPESTAPSIVAVAPSNGPERNIGRQATPAGSELLLYPEPAETGKPLRISAHRQLYIRSQIDSTWYRALYGGTQFYVKRNDVSLLTPSGPGTRGKAPKKPTKK